MGKINVATMKQFFFHSQLKIQRRKEGEGVGQKIPLFWFYCYSCNFLILGSFQRLHISSCHSLLRLCYRFLFLVAFLSFTFFGSLTLIIMSEIQFPTLNRPMLYVLFLYVWLLELK